MVKIKKTESFGEHLRTLREDAGQTLKTVAEHIERKRCVLLCLVCVEKICVR